jgi:hypothetical protein
MPGDGGRPRPAAASGKLGGVALRISSPVLAGAPPSSPGSGPPRSGRRPGPRSRGGGGRGRGRQDRLVGRVYVDLPAKAGHDAEVWLRVRASELASGLEDLLYATVRR